MLINEDHGCTPDCPDCIAMKDLLKSAKKISKKDLMKSAKKSKKDLLKSAKKSKDHCCTPDCPECIAVKDLSKTRKVVPKSFEINTMWLVFIPLLFLVVVAINGQSHQSHEATGGVAGGLNGRQSSTQLAERLERIETLLTDIRLSQTEAANIMAAKEVDTSAIDHPGSSISPDDPPPLASSSNRETKPDFPAEVHEFSFRHSKYALWLALAMMIVWIL